MAGITAEFVLVIRPLILSAVSIISTPLGKLSAIKLAATSASSLAKLSKLDADNPDAP